MLVAVGLNVSPRAVGSTTRQEICFVNLEHPDSVRIFSRTPAVIQGASAACVMGDSLYAVGIGPGRKELWKMSAECGWVQCASMASGRSMHSVAVVGRTLYVVGGLLDSVDVIHDGILSYNTQTNKWLLTSQLSIAVYGAACLAYKNSIYLFGGIMGDNQSSDRIQTYDVIQRHSSVNNRVMPEASSMLRAVLWQNKAIVIGQTSFIYDLENGTLQERKQFKINLVQFGLCLHNQTLFIAGGFSSLNNAVVCSDEVQKVPLVDVLKNNLTVWKHHARLPHAACIQSYGLIAL